MAAGGAPIVVDGHLDMALNVVRGHRDYDVPVAELRRRENRDYGQVMVTLPTLREGGVGIAFGTIFVGTKTYDGDTPVYDPPARERGLAQLALYERWASQGKARLLTSVEELDAHLEAWPRDRVLGLVLLMESADPIASPDDLPYWYGRGLRIVGPAWRRTRYCGGTGMPGGLTDLGRELLVAMRDLRMTLDASHLAEQSFWEALELDPYRVIASHSNVRALVPGDRHLSDDMIRAIGERDGVIGVVPGNSFLDPRWAADGDGPELNLEHVARHMRHIADLIGWERVAIGSDFDGGFVEENTPIEIRSAADLRVVGNAVPAARRDAVLGGNWIRFLRRSLPRTSSRAPRRPAHEPERPGGVAS